MLIQYCLYIKGVPKKCSFFLFSDIMKLLILPYIENCDSKWNWLNLWGGHPKILECLYLLHQIWLKIVLTISVYYYLWKKEHFFGTPFIILILKQFDIWDKELHKFNYSLVTDSLSTLPIYSRTASRPKVDSFSNWSFK